MKLFLFIVTSFLLLCSCASVKHEDIAYLGEDKPTLNVFEPRKSNGKTPVLLFVHGGNWNKGKKEMYWWLGRNFAKKDVLTVLPGYTLSPDANYDEMAAQIAEAIRWTKKHADAYGGDPNQLYITGHSAGGHLGALAVMNPKYGIDLNDIKGIILNDAAGLDMYHYLQEHPPKQSNNYDTTWTKDPEHWKDASPINFLNEDTPPFLIYLGSKTYPSITLGNKQFLDALRTFQPDVRPVILQKKHVPMVTQFIFSWSPRYDEMLHFMNQNK